MSVVEGYILSQWHQGTGEADPDGVFSVAAYPNNKKEIEKMQERDRLRAIVEYGGDVDKAYREIVELLKQKYGKDKIDSSEVGMCIAGNGIQTVPITSGRFHPSVSQQLPKTSSVYGAIQPNILQHFNGKVHVSQTPWMRMSQLFVTEACAGGPWPKSWLIKNNHGIDELGHGSSTSAGRRRKTRTRKSKRRSRKTRRTRR
jgi:hypothetical protein